MNNCIICSTNRSYRLYTIFLLLITIQLLFYGVTPQTFYSIEQNNDNSNNIALTFDDGPHGTLTPRLLDVLKEKGAKATFFVMGVKVRLHPDIVKRAYDEGHEIANHAFDHPVLSKLSFDKVHDQLSSTNELIYSAIKEFPKTMRPPYGNTNKKLNQYISDKERLSVIIWSLDTLDWKRPKPEDIVEKVVKNGKGGTVILCHDIHPGTIEAMPALIDKMKSKGYNFVTVSEMIKNKKRNRQLRGTEYQ